LDGGLEMALKNLPIVLDGYRLLVTEGVSVKTKVVKGEVVPVTSFEGGPQFVVVLFAKPRPGPSGRAGRGEEIRVTLPFEPAESFGEGEYVELVNPTVSYYEVENGDTGRKNSGLSFRADTLTRVIQVAAA
jgi:hypothetical protein